MKFLSILVFLSTVCFGQVTPVVFVTDINLPEISVTEVLFSSGVVSTVTGLPYTGFGSTFYQTFGVQHYYGQPYNPFSSYSQYCFVDPAFISTQFVTSTPVQVFNVFSNVPPGFTIYSQFFQQDQNGDLKFSDLIIIVF